MEALLGHDRGWELGAHYTHETGIMKIVRPTIIEPWRALIDDANTIADVQKVLEELCSFRVLDPARGCGNFLYVAYRESRALEHGLSPRMAKGRCMRRLAQRVASVVSCRPARWRAPMARFRRVAMARGPERVRTVE